ncbi:unnamed protein product [Arabis nemorensis]|uniref:Uncharacterized protein n=1 Tax=Arabis nemorensis TaxID=586526 RepID=A0A565CTQ7_9BRAS|nr:unnamed protein product [Arabis nemorensis]
MSHTEQGRTNLNPMLPEYKEHNLCIMSVSREEPDHEFNPEPNYKWKPKLVQGIVQTTISKVNLTLDQHVLINSMIGLIHLSSPRVAELGVETKGEQTVRKEEIPTMVILASDGKQVQEKYEKIIAQTTIEKQINPSHTYLVLKIFLIRIMHLSCSKHAGIGLGTKDKQWTYGETKNSNSDQKQDQGDSGPSQLNPTDHKHCKAFTISLMFKDEPPDALVMLKQNYKRLGVSSTYFRAALKHTAKTRIGERDQRVKPPIKDQKKPQGVSCLILIKEEPPYTTYKIKPSQNRYGEITSELQVTQKTSHGANKEKMEQEDELKANQVEEQEDIQQINFKGVQEDDFTKDFKLHGPEPYKATTHA